MESKCAPSECWTLMSLLTADRRHPSPLVVCCSRHLREWLHEFLLTFLTQTYVIEGKTFKNQIPVENLTVRLQ